MNYAPLYTNASSGLYDNQTDSFSVIPMNILEGSVRVVNNLIDEPIKIRENLLNVLQGGDIIQLEDPSFQCEEVDSIINQIKLLNSELSPLQDELDEYHKKYKDEINRTKENVDKIDCSIQLIKTCNKDYESNEKVKTIIDSLTEYIQNLNENDNLKSAKEDYINRLKKMNKHLCLLHAINSLNISAVCPICITDRIDSYCNPCGHTACKGCFDRNFNRPSNGGNRNKCPICREQIMSIRKLYFI